MKLTLDADTKLAVLIISGLWNHLSVQPCVSKFNRSLLTIRNHVSRGDGDFGVLNTGSNTHGALVDILIEVNTSRTHRWEILEGITR